MPYKETFCAYVRFKGDRPEIIWNGLTKSQAHWRYHWIRRNWWNEFRDYREFGFTREWQA